MALRRDLRSEFDGAGDRTLDELDAVAEALEAVAHDRRLLSEQIQLMRKSRVDGMEWLEILRTEPGEGSMQLVSQLLARVSDASGRLRKVLVEELRCENVSIPTIANLFAVSHQRVSNVLHSIDQLSTTESPH